MSTLLRRWEEPRADSGSLEWATINSWRVATEPAVFQEIQGGGRLADKEGFCMILVETVASPKDCYPERGSFGEMSAIGDRPRTAGRPRKALALG